MASIDATSAHGVGYALTILVVDDDPDMRYLARVVLEGAGIVIAGEASDGNEALERLRELGPPPVPTVILLDNQMPGPSGIDVAAKILHDLPNQLIILFSAYLSPELVEKATELGVAACVSKGEALNLSTIVQDLVASD